MKKNLSPNAASLAAKKQKRAPQLFATAFAFIALLAVILPTKLSAQVVVPFTQRTSQYTPEQKIYHLKGDFTMIGNTNMTRTDYSATNYNNLNNADMKWINIDAANGAVTNSSSAELKFSTEHGANPECSQVVFAGLYWMGRHDTRLDDNGSSNVTEFTVKNGQRIGSFTLNVSTSGNNNLNSNGRYKNVTYNFTRNGISANSHYVRIENYDQFR